MQKLVINNLNGESITLGNIAPYFLEILDGVGEVPVSIESQKAPKQDGSTYIDNTLENRAITIEGMIVTKNNPRLVWEARRRMQRVLNPKLGEVTITYYYGRQTKKIKGVAETTPTFPSGQGNKGIYYQKYLIHLLCHQPFWLDPYYESREMAAWIGGLSFPLRLPTTFAREGQEQIFENIGDVSTPVTVEFYGPATNPRLDNLTTGEFIRIKRDLLVGEKLIIKTEFGNKRVTLIDTNNTVINAMHWIDLDSVFWQLQPGENRIKYNADAGVDKARVKVSWCNRYVGV